MIRSPLLFIAVLASILSNSCQNNDGNEPHLAYGAAHSFTLYPIVLDNMVILPMHIDGKDGLVGLDLGTQDTLWTYTDEKCKALYYNLSSYTFGNRVYLPDAKGILSLGRSPSSLDYIESEGAGLLQAHLQGEGERIILAKALDGRRRYEIHSFDAQTKEFSILQRIEADTGRRLLMRPARPFRHPANGQRGFAAPLVDFKPKGTTFSYFLFWMEGGPLDSVQAIRPNTKGLGATRPPLLTDSLAIWLVHDTWVAISLANLAEVWRLPLPAPMLTSKPFLSDGILYSAMENERLYAIRPHTGDTLWSRKISGTPSRIYSRDSTVHLIGGVDGKYYRFHQKTGEALPVPESGVFLARTFYADEEVTIVGAMGKWWIGTSIEAIVDRWNRKATFEEVEQ